MKKSKNNFYYKNNRLQQLRGFYHTAIDGSITKAAKSMSLSQSAVSTQVKSLEITLGMQLFRREGINLVINEHGKKLLTMVEPLLQNIDQVYEQFLDGETLQQSQELRIASQHASSTYLLPEVIAKFKKEYPSTEITIHNCAPMQGLDLLEAGTVDLLIGSYEESPLFAESTLIKSCETVAVCHKDHPLAQQENIKMTDLQNHPLITNDRANFTIKNFAKVIEQYELVSEVHLVDSDWPILKKYVQQNFAAAIISSLNLDGSENDICSHSLSEYFPPVEYSCFTNKKQTTPALVKVFIDTMVKQHLA